MLPSELLKSFNERSLKIKRISNNNIDLMKVVFERISQNKAIYTVLITLSLYKIMYPEQDIRFCRKELPNGFSGRGFDTKYITPTLKELKLPSMAESGWLTRSLEQAQPYTLDYKGKISPIQLKNAFLQLVQKINDNQKQAETILLELLFLGNKYKNNNKIEIKSLKEQDIEISKIVSLLKEHFETIYHVHNGAKLPMIAFYTIYSILVPEIKRYADCKLLKLGKLTASDRTSASAGDIQIEKNKKIFEAVEIKLDRDITPIVVENAFDKINKFGISRYYILSGKEIKETNQAAINTIVQEIKVKHGCQVIVNGLYNSLKYYLRLIEKPVDFLNLYIDFVKNDEELEKKHKEKLKDLLKKYFNI